MERRVSWLIQRWPIFFRAILPFLCLMLTASTVSAADSWKAGAAKISITPTKPMWMAGYASRNHPADGQLTELWAKALVLEDSAGERAVIVTLDLVGIHRQTSQAICQSLEKSHQLARNQIAINCSHTHSGPVVGRNLPMHFLSLEPAQQELIEEYEKTLVANIVKVVGAAIAKIAPSQLAWGSGTATFAVNRRNNPEADVPKIREAGTLKGPVDHDVPVLAVRSATGELTAILFGYACHATVLPLYQWCGDYPGYAQIELEKSHPNSIALFWAGCGADQNPLPRRTVELAMQYGQYLAKSVDAVLVQEMKPIPSSLQTDYREIPLSFASLPDRKQWETESKDSNTFVAARAKWHLQELDAGRPINPTYPYPISSWRLGKELDFIFLGGEVVVDFSLRLKSELRGRQTWVAGYSHDVMAYIPSRRVLTEGGYEGAGAMVFYGLPTSWGPDVEEAIVKSVHTSVKQGK